MAKRKRNIQILFCVSPEEKKLIRRKMIESKTKNMGALLVLLSRLKNTYWMCSYPTFSKRLLTTCVGTASPLIC